VRILAIETSAQECSVALAHAAGIVQRSRRAGARVAEQALAMIAELLAEQSVTLKQVDAYAFGSGPGAFTGLRVACALVQGLAFAGDRPVVPVGSLRALAYGVMAATDARMGQIYWAVYEGARAERQLAAPALAAPEQVAGLTAQWRPHLIAGDALRAFDAAWPAPSGTIRLPDATADASMIAELALTELGAGRAVAARDAVPEYVRDQVALTVAQRAGLDRSAAP
jgi:tRNA threonylcarbamoyladenosine biosynthesis protein TsaB